MAKFTTPESEQYALNSSRIFNGIVVFFLMLILLALIFPESSAGFGIFVGILGPPFVVIAFIRNVTLIAKVTSKGRRTYAIIASVITGIPLIAFLVLLFKDVLFL